ncbi:hypothetical protein A4X13_0g6277 [Tilletia indica]|uniref:Uncharacterized protein n=1 Tax=Tilletia indica TaxID=43049 RepID=A0A177TC32_9BASI|nr:hypothetical protein A4X13_0g6277 [Tilletia indica]
MREYKDKADPDPKWALRPAYGEVQLLYRGHKTADIELARTCSVTDTTKFWSSILLSPFTTSSWHGSSRHTTYIPTTVITYIPVWLMHFGMKFDPKSKFQWMVLHWAATQPGCAIKDDTALSDTRLETAKTQPSTSVQKSQMITAWRLAQELPTETAETGEMPKRIC